MDKLPDIDNCNERIYKYNGLDKKGYKHNNKVVYRPKNPYAKHKKFVKDTISNMTDDEFVEFFKTIDWAKYEKK